MRTILHVDMDAFFASVEQSRHPEWRGRPVIVGAGPHERGVVSTCSYEARRFGVHSAMPSRTAYALCPHAIFVPPHGDLYREVSALAFKSFGRYSPYVESVSVDEAFLDITGTLHLFGNDPRTLGEALRADVRRACGVTCSVGIAPNRLLAKIGSEQNKPDGLTLMPFSSDAIARFLAPKPIGILWGVGKKTVEILKPYGIRTCGDVQRLLTDGSDALENLLGTAASAQLGEYAFGRDSSEVAWEESSEKSVSREHTFDEDESDRGKIREKLLELVRDVGRRLRSEPRWARTAKLKLRDARFNTATHQIAFVRPVCDDFALREAALELFDEMMPADAAFSPRPVRLIGFGVTNFQDTPDDEGQSLFADPADDRRKKRERLSSALDALRDAGMNLAFCADRRAGIRQADGVFHTEDAVSVFHLPIALSLGACCLQNHNFPISRVLHTQSQASAPASIPTFLPKFSEECPLNSIGARGRAFFALEYWRGRWRAWRK